MEYFHEVFWNGDQRISIHSANLSDCIKLFRNKLSFSSLDFLFWNVKLCSYKSFSDIIKCLFQFFSFTDR